jgi:hypothetical protein
MLRYDCCVPRTQDDVSAAFTNEHDLRTVELTGFAARGIRLQPTDARWASFGWSVIAGSVQEVMGC